MQAARVDESARAFAHLAALPDPPVEALALAIAAAFRDGPVDQGSVTRRIDELAAEVRPIVAAAAGDATREAAALGEVLGQRHGFTGDRDDYDAPRNSFLDVVLERRRGLPILLSVLWLAVAGRTGVELVGVGLPGHFVVAHVGATPLLLLDPFAGGGPCEGAAPVAVPVATPHDIALRMLGNLALAYERRGDPGQALRAARLRLLLPTGGALREQLEQDALRLGARFN